MEREFEEHTGSKNSIISLNKKIIALRAKVNTIKKLC
jgi:hypothetical protein